MTSKSEFNTKITYADAILNSMHFALETNQNSVLIGQGIGDFKGIFGTTSGLQQEFGKERVIESPIAEEMMTGISLGMSLNGLYPIMTHIRADFSFVAMNQIVNLYAKYKYMFGGQFKPSGLIRMIVGRSWGQGAQHAQSPQSIFSHFPGVKVLMPSSAQEILNVYKHEITNANSLVISFEHRNLFELNFNVDKNLLPRDAQTKKLRTGDDLTIVATSIMVLESLRASEFLEENYGINIEVIDLVTTTHFDSEVIIESVKKTGKLVIADTSWTPYGVGSELSRVICEKDPSVLKAPIKVIGMQHTPCPTGKVLEDMFYPSVRTIVMDVLDVCSVKAKNLPDGTSYRDFYKKFRGPF